MSGLPDQSALSDYCVCEDCLYGCQETCVFNRMHHQHAQTVAAILTTGSQEMLEINFTVNQTKQRVTCHSSLICYWSGTIKTAVYSQPSRVRSVWIDFEYKDDQVMNLWKQVIQWCYTGRLFDPQTMSDAAIGKDDDLEILWTAAISLDMGELANYCMHLIIIKYSCGFSARADWVQKLHPRDCPYDAWGPHHVYINCYQMGTKYRKLLDFVEEHIGTGGPLAPRKVERASQATIQSWRTLLERDEDFSNWIEYLGGLEREGAEVTLPTHFNQWGNYMVHVLPRIPQSVIEWSKAHDEVVRREGHQVDLCGIYENAGTIEDPDYQWTFYSVATGWPQF
ncbi:hypothetical protein F4805DRAFT_475725 [Annulohypoxylon moriforme]|nr:hypothetical protein F4805DRAFT_475725 [Annulohypoxylon moriforme]